MTDRILSLAALTVLEAGPLKMPEIARRCGFSHVGLRPIAATPGECHTPLLGHAANIAELRAALSGEGIGVLDCEIVRLVPEMDWDLMARVVDFARLVGASRLLVADNDPETSRSKASLARLAELCRAAGVVACLEFMPWTAAPDLASARARTAGVEGAALLIDAFHLARSGGHPDQIREDDAISYLQLCDIAGPIPSLDEILREARSDRLFPGEGTLPLPALLQRFPAAPVSLEVPADRLRDSGVGPEQRAALAIAAARRLVDSVDA